MYLRIVGRKKDCNTWSHRHNSASTKLATKTCLESQIQVHSGSEAATYKITTSWPNKLNESSSVPAATTCVKGCTCSIPFCIERVVLFIIIIILIMLPHCCNTSRNVVLGCTVLCIESSSPEEEDNENVVDMLMLALCIYVSGSNNMCCIKPIKLGILLQTCKTGTHTTCHILQQRWQCQCQHCDDTCVDKCWAHLAALWTLGTWTLRLDYGLVD